MSKWIAEFELEDGDTMPEHMDLNYMGTKIDFHCRPLEQDTCEDCVSRDMVHEMLENVPINPNDKWFNWLQKACLRLAELPSVQPKTEWIPISERMQEEHEWVGTERFGTTVSDKVHVTFEAPNGKRFTKQLVFHNGKLSKAKQDEIDAFCKGAVPIAWMPLPEPYRGSEG